MKTLTIFEYKGNVGATSDVESGTFLNDIKVQGQMGIVVAVSETQISPAALEIMKTNYEKESGSFAPTMLTRAQDNSCSVGLLGFNKHGIAMGTPALYGRTCDLTVLDEIPLNPDVLAPQEFKDMIDEAASE